MLNEYQLVCEVKGHGQPRIARDAAAQLRLHCDQIGSSAYGVLIAPHLSPASQEICREYGVGFLDFEGNCRLVFNGVFIERVAATKPVAERRELRSIFAPKSAQVIRVLLRDPTRYWKVVDLAEAAEVSLGHVSNVRSALIEHEWAVSGKVGLYVTAPDALLDSWQQAYLRPPGTRQTFYTTLHGRTLAEAVRRLMQSPRTGSQIMLGSFSAAQWFAPYARTATEFFYANTKGLHELQSALELSSAVRGENVIVMELDDDGLFRDAVEPAPGTVRTSPGADLSRSLYCRASRPRGGRASEEREAAMAPVKEPRTAADYDGRTNAAVRSVLVEIGQILGSYKGKFAVIGGAVPWLLLNNDDMKHVGTIDIDLSLDNEALADGEYAGLVEELMKHDYQQRNDLKRFQLVRSVDIGDGGEPIEVIIDFLMPRDAVVTKNQPALIEDFAVQKADGRPHWARRLN